MTNIIQRADFAQHVFEAAENNAALKKLLLSPEEQWPLCQASISNNAHFQCAMAYYNFMYSDDWHELDEDQKDKCFYERNQRIKAAAEAVLAYEKLTTAQHERVNEKD